MAFNKDNKCLWAIDKLIKCYNSNNDKEQLIKYVIIRYNITNDNSDLERIVYQYYLSSNFDLMKKYHHMLLEKGCTGHLNYIHIYYMNIDDYSFFDLYKYKKNPTFYYILTKLENNIILPKEYYPQFCQQVYSNASPIVIMKQYVLKKTGIWCIKNPLKHITEFIELVAISESNVNQIIPKNIILMIAGYLFI